MTNWHHEHTENSYLIFEFPSFSIYLALSLRPDKGTYSLSMTVDGACRESPRKSW